MPTSFRSVEVGGSLDSLEVVCILNDVEDINETQTFNVYDSKYAVDGNKVIPNANTPLSENSFTLRKQKICHRFLRLKFPSSSDFYGRITIYNLEVHGFEQIARNPNL